MIIIKIGGGAEINLSGIVEDIAQLKEQVVIVHGANAKRDQLAKELGWSKRVVTSISGYSSVFSDEQAIDLLMMAYAGLKNKRIVELCQQQGVNAIGLSGLDGRMIEGARNQGIRVQEGEKKILLKDFSGKPKRVNQDLLRLLLEHGYVPVLCVPIIDQEGFAINSENDDIIVLLQEALHANCVIQLIEAPGFLLDPKDAKSLVKKITPEELEQRESQVEGRMKRKMLALRKLFAVRATRVIISDGRIEHPVQDALNGSGTVIE